MDAFPMHQPPYPHHAFPFLMRQTIEEVQRNIQAPYALVSMAILGATSLSCQGLISVKLPTGKECPVSLNLLCIAESGERKSTVDALIYEAFHQADQRAAAKYKLALETYRAELNLWAMEKLVLQRSSHKRHRKSESLEALVAERVAHANREPSPPRLRQFIRENITSRAIIKALEGTNESIGLITDEGDVLFRTDAMKHVGMLNRAYDSPALLPLDRVECEHVYVSRPCVTVSIQSQSSVVMKHFSKYGDTARGSGHLARYLIAWPASTKGWRVVQTSEHVWEHLPRLQARFTELIEAYTTAIDSGVVNRRTIEFNEDAKARWFQQAATTEWMLRPGDYLHDLHDFGSKAMEIVARVAALLHHASGEEGKISLDTLDRAIAIVGWHVDEAKRLFSADFSQPQDQVDAKSVCAYLRHRVWAGPSSNSWIAKNLVLRNGPVRDRGRLNAALDYLIRIGAIWIGVAPVNKRKFVNLYDTFFSSM